ncbi:hypothetical protein, partial [Trinickia soli]|uniref:hypothetical protein n=1 Tax=Trinickia soli TaxID=380675 RepID=UPI003FA39073
MKRLTQQSGLSLVWLNTGVRAQRCGREQHLEVFGPEQHAALSSTLHRQYASPAVRITGSTLHRQYASPAVRFTRSTLHKQHASQAARFTSSTLH